MRKVPTKNYIIMVCIVISIVIITMILANIYNNRFQKTSIMYNYLPEIKKKDFNTYILENPSTIIYISDKYDITQEKNERKIKKDIIKNNAKDYFVYLNISNDNMDYIDKLNNTFKSNINKKIPVIIVVEEGKIAKVYYELSNIDVNELTGDIK